MSKNYKLSAIRIFASAVAVASLAACGGGGGGGGGGFPGGIPGGGGGNGAGTGATVSGTAARGAMLVGATVEMTCANGAKLAGSTNGLGAYVTNSATVVYPCIGSAKLGTLSYRGMLFSGAVASFSPLTDMMTEVVLAASAPGAASMTVAQFIAKIGADVTFAGNVSSPTSTAAYRTATLDVAKAALMVSGKSDADATSILSAARSQNFDSVAFGVGSPLDLVLDNTGAVLLAADGSVLSTVLAAARAAGDLLPTPASGATGATGASGG